MLCSKWRGGQEIPVGEQNRGMELNTIPANEGQESLQSFLCLNAYFTAFWIHLHIHTHSIPNLHTIAFCYRVKVQVIVWKWCMFPRWGVTKGKMMGLHASCCTQTCKMRQGIAPAKLWYHEISRRQKERTRIVFLSASWSGSLRQKGYNHTITWGLGAKFGNYSGFGCIWVQFRR